MVSKIKLANFDEAVAIRKDECDELIVKEYLVNWLNENDFLCDENADVNTAFSELGLNSIDAVGLIEDVRADLGISLDPTVAWKYPNVRKLSRYIVSLNPVVSQSNDNIDLDKNNAKTQIVTNDSGVDLESSDLNSLAFELEVLLGKRYSNIERDESL